MVENTCFNDPRIPRSTNPHVDPLGKLGETELFLDRH